LLTLSIFLLVGNKILEKGDIKSMLVSQLSILLIATIIFGISLLLIEANFEQIER